MYELVSSFCSFFLVFLKRYLLPLIFKLIQKSNILNLYLEANSEAYLELCQTSKMKVFAKIVSAFSF